MSNRNDDQKQDKHPSQTEEVNQTGGPQHASADQGGTTDLTDDALNIGHTNSTERGSGSTTKRNVTGSDFDGQSSY